MRERVGQYLCDLREEKDFSSQTPKISTIRQKKKSEFPSIKIKDFCSKKDMRIS
jgi:hypothetical protein